MVQSDLADLLVECAPEAAEVITEYVEALGHGSDPGTPLFRPVGNNRYGGKIDGWDVSEEYRQENTEGAPSDVGFYRIIFEAHPTTSDEARKLYEPGVDLAELLEKLWLYIGTTPFSGPHIASGPHAKEVALARALELVAVLLPGHNKPEKEAQLPADVRNALTRPLSWLYGLSNRRLIRDMLLVGRASQISFRL